ncbi:MAG: arginine--tRNA ligase [Leptospirales bacterium]|nr:arginine--tRNA ligase [Leptospirales bacterium]
MNIKSIIYNIIKKSIESAVAEGKLPDAAYPAIKVEYPKESKFGDYSTPVALESAKLLKRSPMEIGEILIQYIKRDSGIVGLVELSKPGFINIFISLNYLKENMIKVIDERENYGKSVKNNPIKYNIEFVSANPTGPMNVVSARAAALGDSIANLIEARGDLVDREFYVNDFGNQVDLLGESVLARIKEIKGEPFIFPEDGYRGEYIKDIARSIIDNFHEELNHINEEDRVKFISKKSVEFNVANQKKDLEDFNVFFKRWFRESSLHEKGEVGEALKKLEDSNHIYIEDGKKIFKSTGFGDDKDRVVVRDDGRPTYLMADIAYHYDKLERGYDYLIDIWGPDHHGYIARLSGAVEALCNRRDIFKVLISQQVNLIMEGETVKMSKRLGNFSTMRELIDEVGVDVSRFFFIMRSMDSHLDFDLALAKKNSSENPVFYLQYAHARICSIFREADKRGIEKHPEKTTAENLDNSEALTILKLLARFPEEISDAADTFEPHKIATYLMRLAQVYHRFYTEHRVISDDDLKTQTNLALCDAVRITIKNGLKLLGVSAPESM